MTMPSARHPWLAALLLLAAGASQAQGPVVSLDVIEKYAPTIHLHPYDNHHPMAVEEFLSECSMLNASGNVLKSGLAPADLTTYSSSTNYLKFTNSVFPSDTNEFETGDPIVPGATAGWGQSNAPIYVKTIDNGSYIDIKYYMFYGINGFQTFQAGIIVNFKTQPYLFDWASFALHQGDWEHVSIGLDGNDKPLFVALSAHCGGQLVPWRDVNAAPGRLEGKKIVIFDPKNRAAEEVSHPIVAVARGRPASAKRRAGKRLMPGWPSLLAT